MPTKQEQSDKFNIIYNGLNQQQRKAVDTIEGPVMVIAGPGTGKTQILSARIGKILLETDAQPQNILCLTYTDAGVVAMRRRLLGFIGPDAYKVHIYTFHAFCNDVIQDNLGLFEKLSLDAISELEKMDMYRRLIDAFPKNHPLKRYRGDVYFEINNLQHLFSIMKREGWTPNFINQKIDEYITSLPQRDGYVAKKMTGNFKKGDIRTDKIEEETEKMERLRAAVNEFDRFQQLMRNANRYDFDDMINWVLDAFENNKSLLANYQEQYQYILVDEYQDTSGTQNKLVELLINFWEKPNVFVVGDDDQSIYRFQGANVENMYGFATRYAQDLLTVVLTNNYRSVQPILDVSKTLIDRNTDRLVSRVEGLSKELLASKNFSNISHPLIKEYEKQGDEMAGITLRVQKLLAQDTEPGRIAVIYKENKYGEELLKYFKQVGIPVYSKRSLNIFNIPLAQQIILVLRYLASEHDIPFSGDEMLFEILHFNWFNIPAIDIARLSIELSERNFKSENKTLRGLLDDKAKQPPKDLFSQGINPNLKKASEIIEKLVEAVPNVTLQILLEHIMREAGVLNFIMQSPEKIWLLQVLTAFFEFVKEETHRNPTLKLQAFINIIDIMENEGIPLPLVQVSGSDKGVNLLTAHGSKGLEFDTVFFAGCNAAFWEKKRNPFRGYKFPDTMFSTASNDNSNRDTEELRRLFYVALTRAEQHLEISYSRFRNDGKEMEASLFIAEIQEQHELPVEKVIMDEEVIAEFQLFQLQAPTSPEIAKVEEELVGRLLEKFVMNVTALNNYLKCPLEFYFKNLIRIPSPKNEAMEFGSAIHYALEQLFKKMSDGNNQFPPGEIFVQDFEWYMRRHRESFTREQYNRRLEYGQEVLRNYYNVYVDSWNRIVSIERNIKTVVDSVPVKGKLDKLEFDGKNVNCVDYKTGDVDKAKDKLAPPNEKQPNGGDYWRQAVFYKILVDNYEAKQWNLVSTEFDFVEPDKKKKYRRQKVVIQPQDVTTVKEQIRTVWEKIQQRDFYTGCGKPDCHWCNFVKTNNLAVALHEIEEEEPNE